MSSRVKVAMFLSSDSLQNLLLHRDNNQVSNIVIYIGDINTILKNKDDSIPLTREANVNRDKELPFIDGYMATKTYFKTTLIVNAPPNENIDYFVSIDGGAIQKVNLLKWRFRNLAKHYLLYFEL
jgi:hypothetical protein